MNLTNGQIDCYQDDKSLCRIGTSIELPSVNVLVLYTGGTIGMKDFGNGYEPVPTLLENTLRANGLFCDKSVPGYDDSEVGGAIYLPTDSKPGHESLHRVRYTIREYVPLIDSCGMQTKEYQKIALDIAENYKLYDAFIVLHGTDTLAYTASVLSFMMENLGKTIILTGSQIPFYEIRSDGRDNLLGALQIAGYYTIPEVAVFFDNNLYRGNRVNKTHSMAFHAFTSPNLPPLVVTGVAIQINWPIVWKPSELAPFVVFTDVNPNVAILRLFPSLTINIMQRFLEPPIQGVVLQTYGAGNISIVDKEFLGLLHKATQQGIFIINTTQCHKGTVLSVYATGKALQHVGVISGGDMTSEAAIAKLMYVLGKPWTLDEKREALTKSLRGEMVADIETNKPKVTMKKNDLLDSLANIFELPTASSATKMFDELLPSLINAAVAHDDICTLKKLYGFVGHFQMTDAFGRTPLHNAALTGNLDATKYLLSKGCLLNTYDYRGNTPLMLAISKGHVDLIETLVSTGAHLNVTAEYKIGSDMCILAAANQWNVLRGYAMSNIDLNQGDYDNRRPMHIAVHFAHKETVTYLLQNGCDPNLTDNFGRTCYDELASIADPNVREEVKNMLDSSKKH